MEKKVLPKPAVADVLKKHFIEARLHTDGEYAGIERVLEVQKRFAESVANPIYVNVDPVNETRLTKFEGATVTKQDEERFVKFLVEAVEMQKPKVSKVD